MRLYIGCGPSPIHPQHQEVLGNHKDWVFVDKYVDEPHIKQWDGMVLDEVDDGSIEEIYSSHTLEHFEHNRVLDVLRLWKSKMCEDALLTINVPDLNWALKRLQQLEADVLVGGYYNTYTGEHGVMSIIYGSQSHDGEYHKSGYTYKHLKRLLSLAEFREVDIKSLEDAHDMGVLIATCRK